MTASTWLVSLKLTTRVRNALANENISSFEQLADAAKRHGLREIPNLGPRGIEEISRALPDIKIASPASPLPSTLRDQFAAAALRGLLSNPKLHAEILARSQPWISESAWAWADDMIRTRQP